MEKDSTKKSKYVCSSSKEYADVIDEMGEYLDLPEKDRESNLIVICLALVQHGIKLGFFNKENIREIMNEYVAKFMSR